MASVTIVFADKVYTNEWEEAAIDAAWLDVCESKSRGVDVEAYLMGMLGAEVLKYASEHRDNSIVLLTLLCYRCLGQSTDGQFFLMVPFSLGENVGIARGIYQTQSLLDADMPNIFDDARGAGYGLIPYQKIVN